MSDETVRADRDHQESYEEYARKMRLFEDGPTTTNFQQLVDGGITLTHPDALPDAEVAAKLFEVIHALAQLRVYLEGTDHLSDKDLYATLWHDTLREGVPAIDDLGFNHCVHLLSGGGEPETMLYLKYFADEDYRQHWLEEFPGYDMPVHEDPPHNRDRLLPRPQ